MRPNVDELQSFYASRQGQIARRLIGHHIRQLWPELRGLNVLGLGFPTPFLGGLEGAARLIALMPQAQGACAWPPGMRNRVALAGDDNLPLDDRSVDRVLMVHGLECSAKPQRLMREVWRVLADGGRLIVVVPNRRGLWSLSERTPFGHGQPYSAGQLDRTLQHHLFAPLVERGALFLPPLGSRLLLRLAVPTERLGLGLAPRFAGVVLIEAEKRIYVVPAEPASAQTKARRYVPVPSPTAARTAARMRHGERALHYWLPDEIQDKARISSTVTPAHAILCRPPA